MKLANDALVAVIEILRKGLTEGCDVSEMLRSLDLEPNGEGRLALKSQQDDVVWKTKGAS